MESKPGGYRGPYELDSPPARSDGGRSASGGDDDCMYGEVGKPDAVDMYGEGSR